MPLKIDDVVLPVAQDRARQFECEVCFGVLADPVESGCCHHFFCRECVLDVAGCPTCRHHPLAKMEPSPGYLRLINDLEVRCPNHVATDITSVKDASDTGAGGGSSGSSSSSEGAKGKRAGEEESDASDPEGCKWEGNCGDLLAKHLHSCPFTLVECEMGCGEAFQRRNLELHKASCLARREVCTICGETTAAGGMAAHNEKAAQKHVGILQAKLSALQGCEKPMAVAWLCVDANGLGLEQLSHNINSKKGVYLSNSLHLGEYEGLVSMHVVSGWIVVDLLVWSPPVGPPSWVSQWTIEIWLGQSSRQNLTEAPQYKIRSTPLAKQISEQNPSSNRNTSYNLRDDRSNGIPVSVFRANKSHGVVMRISVYDVNHISLNLSWNWKAGIFGSSCIMEDR